MQHSANVVIMAVLGYVGVSNVPLSTTIDGVSMNTLRYQQVFTRDSVGNLVGWATVNVTYAFATTATTSNIVVTFPSAGSESLVVYGLRDAQPNFVNTNVFFTGGLGNIRFQDTLNPNTANGLGLMSAACALASVGITPLDISGVFPTITVGYATTEGSSNTFTQGTFAGRNQLSPSSEVKLEANATTGGSSSWVYCAIVDTVVLPVTSLSVLNQLYDSCAAGNAYPSLATKPYPSSRWTVVLPDGGQFVFWQNCQGGIQYMESWSYISAPAGPFTFISDFTSTHLLTQSFTFSNGWLSADGSTFTFDYIFASGPDELSVCQISSPMGQLDGQGFHYLDGMPADSCSRVTLQTLGHPVDLNAVNLPDGSAIIGDMEQQGATYYANVYLFGVSSSGTVGIGLLNYFYNSVPQVAIVEYIEPTAYYVVTGEGQRLATTVYSADSSTGFISGGSIIGTTRSSELTSVAADSDTLYIAGFDGRTIFITAYRPTGTMSGTGNFTIDAINNLNFDGSVKPVPVDLHITTHGPPVTSDGHGAHLYFQYKDKSTGHFLMGAAWTQNGNIWGAVANVLDVTANDLLDSSANAELPSLNDGGRASSPEVDRITISGLNNTLNGFNVVSHYISLPAQINLKYVSTYTSTYHYKTVSTTTTETTIPLSPTVGGTDFLNLILMFIIVAIPAACFSTFGYLSGGGKAGGTFLIIGTLAGIFLGLLLGYWPNWIIFFIVLGIAVMYWRSRGPSDTSGATAGDSEGLEGELS